MSEAVTALSGASSVGPVAQVEERGLQGMVSLRAELAEPALAGAVRAATGCELPEMRQILSNGDRAVAWMSPDELLLLVPYAETSATVAGLEEALAGVHHIAVDVSDARASFSVSGPGAREVLARLCPVDLSPESFGPGEIRRTRLAQVPAAFWMEEGGRFSLVCFRSVARYAFDVLSNAASGDKVGFFSEN